VDLLGIGAGGLFALGVAARLGAGREHEEGPPAARRLQVAHLAVVSAAHRMSEAAREDAAGWIADAQKLRWRSVHAAMVRRSYAGGQALFYASLAWLFPDLLGTTDYPWDYIITVREAAATELADRLDGINVPTLILGGERDGMFSPADMEEAARRIPGAELGLIPGAGHAIAKSHRREVEGRVTSFLKQ
jgi:pimeloyl-ACP methyl ester carboxylesterase